MATEIKVPDIGDFNDVEIIEMLVEPGDAIDIETPLMTLETDKASMDVPSPMSGTVKELKVKTGDKVSEGSLILLLEPAETSPRVADRDPMPAVRGGGAPEGAGDTGGSVEKVLVPDIGDFSDVPVIEVLVRAGDTIRAEDPLITVESDKASMDAAFIVIAGMGLQGVRKLKLELGESAMVVGLGLLGMFAVQAARLSGAIPVIVSDFDPARPWAQVFVELTTREEEWWTECVRLLGIDTLAKVSKPEAFVDGGALTRKRNCTSTE